MDLIKDVFIGSTEILLEIKYLLSFFAFRIDLLKLYIRFYEKSCIILKGPLFYKGVIWIISDNMMAYIFNV